MTLNVAVLDDYQNVARGYAEWTALKDAAVTFFNDHLRDEDALAKRLKDFDVICMMRERTPIGAGAAAGLWPLRRRNPILTDFRARIVQEAIIDALARASDTIVRVTVTNLGTQTWPAFGRRPVRVAYHWLDAAGRMVEYDGIRSILPRDVGPGESVTVDCFLRAPELPGDRLLAP